MMVIPGRNQFLERESSSRCICEDTKVALSSPEEKSAKQTRSVMFADKESFCTTIRRTYYTREEKHLSFWSRKELQRMKTDMRVQVVQLQRQQKIDPDELSVTKRFTKIALKNRKTTRRQAIRTVIHQQKIMGKLDEFWVNHNYRPLCSHSATLSAYIRALDDQEPHRASAPFLQIIVR
jgi:hypothetical protein